MRRLMDSTRWRFIACVVVSNLLSGLVSIFVWMPLADRLLTQEKPLGPWMPMLLSILLAIPNIIFGFYGMNITTGLPLDHFWWIPLAIVGVVVLVAAVLLKKKDLF